MYNFISGGCGRGGGGGEGNLRVILVGYGFASQFIETYPNHIQWSLKKMTHSYT